MRRTRLTRGHTLIEVMFASFMALCCALIYTATVPTANTSRAKADLNNRATSLAQRQLEEVRLVGFPNLTGPQLFANGMTDSAAPVSGGNTWAWTNTDNAQVDSPAQVLPGGTGQIRVEDVAMDLRRVTVTVSWRERTGNRTVTFATLVANL